MVGAPPPPPPPRTCLLHMAPRWVRRMPGPRWGLLLEPNGPCELQLQSQARPAPEPVGAERPGELPTRPQCPAGPCGHRPADEGLQGPLLLSLEQNRSRGGPPGIWARGLPPRAGSWLHWDRQLGGPGEPGP
uniref:Uncharacterized protein n=1 Tax=Myotis myotis TaxID=51298 RepID=A0A7J7R3M7_MYOMY|nr:hypothetical protein mMyoMyo1_010904 [Myotis myotis]